MRTPPTMPYTGLTLILDQPSRFDESHLLSGIAASWFEESCLTSPHTLASIDIRDINCIDKLLPNTKFIVLSGEKAAEKYETTTKLHGYPLRVQGIPAVATFYIQDCCDHRSMRGDDDESSDNVSDRDTKDAAPTRRKNWRFWTSWHIRKLLAGPKVKPPALIPITYPNLEEAITVLNNTHNEDLYLDIETSRIHRCLTVIGFSTNKTFPRVFVIPVYLYNGSLAYGNFHRFHRALSAAFLRNKVVAHNGAGFDFFVLHVFYKFPLPIDPYDTMLANHRCFLEIEKSLSHLISQWTDQPYHKDQNLEPFNLDQSRHLWEYNAKDVYNLKLIKDAQLSYAANDQGLLNSIAQANSSVVPYLITTRHGLRLDTFKLADTYRRLAAHRDLYARIASILIAQDFNPGSSTQCAKYFHNTLNYPIVSRTEQGAPAMGSKQLYQLQLKHNNPLISVIIKYRTVAKDASSLESELWEVP